MWDKLTGLNETIAFCKAPAGSDGQKLTKKLPTKSLTNFFS